MTADSPIDALLTGGCFFSAHEGRYVEFSSTEHSLTPLIEGDTFGFFFQPARQVLILTKNDLTLGDEYKIPAEGGYKYVSHPSYPTLLVLRPFSSVLDVDVALDLSFLLRSSWFLSL